MIKTIKSNKLELREVELLKGTSLMDRFFRNRIVIEVKDENFLDLLDEIDSASYGHWFYSVLPRDRYALYFQSDTDRADLNKVLKSRPTVADASKLMDLKVG